MNDHRRPSIRDKYLPFGRPNFGGEEIAAVSRVLRGGWVGMGPETIAFEHELEAFVGAPHVVTVNSCTSALFLALKVSGIQEGDEVICPSLTWYSTANAALYLGAVPVFSDVDPETYCLTPESILKAVTPRTKAVLVVHLGGYAVDVAALRKAVGPDLAIVEDAAHALGSRYPQGGPVGSSGNPVCFSFYANKNLATGEGGAIALSDGRTADRLRVLRQHGLPADAWKRFSSPQSVFHAHEMNELGYKMNYTDLQAAIGRVQLKRQGEFHAARIAIARYYRERVAQIIPGAQFQKDCLSESHARHLFLVKLPRGNVLPPRDELILRLRSRNVGATVHYSPLHRMKLYHRAEALPLPATEDVCGRLLTLPISASMNLADAAYVTDQLERALVGSAPPATAAAAGSPPAARASGSEPAAKADEYGFYGRLSAEFPSQVIIDTTEICNLACVHCPHPTFKKSAYYSGACLDAELNAKAIDEVRDHGRGHTQYVRYTGEGETLLHKEFFAMLAYATAHAGVTVTVTTNGVLLDEGRAEKLLDCGPDLVDISIDAYSAEVYAAVRVKGDLNRTRANVINLLRLRGQYGARTKVVVSFIEQPQNRHETADFEKFWKGCGADYVAVRRLHSAAGALPGVAAAMRKEGAETPRRPCVYPWERVVLNPRGHLSFCPADWTHGSTIADYRATTIRETWRSNFYEQLRQAHLSGDFSKHSFCGQCPDWRVTVWPQRGGHSYADMVQDFKDRE